jgi:light-regulated signal transduction histidine kinase (bacteriophytochrome)
MNFDRTNAYDDDANSLRVRIAELERNAHEQTAGLDATASELEAFIHAVSHDMRAPLRGIAGFTRVLMEEHATKLDPEGQRTLRLVREEVQRMSAHIEGVLMFSQVGRQRLDASEIDMTELARSAFQNVADLRGNRVPLELKPLPPARGDRRMVRQVLTNFLDNAVKFAAHKTAARIEMTGSTTNGWSTYCVSDDGVGFDQRYAHKLFGIFQRLHSQDEFEGSGVGLATVRRIVHRHGGRTWAEGRAGAGAQFHFTLPTGNAAQL